MQGSNLHHAGWEPLLSLLLWQACLLHDDVLTACAVQKGEREVAQMQQCKAWWDQQAALAAQQREQQLLDKQEQAATVRWAGIASQQEKSLVQPRPSCHNDTHRGIQ